MTTALFDELKPPLGADEARVEANRCLECGGAHAPAPCTVACPADVDVPGFVTAIAEGDPAHAAEVIFAENLLGGTCARVCPTELLCEGACVLAHEGRRPIEIGRLQRHAADVGLVEPRNLRRSAARSGFRVAVVGAGPAGLACAGELAALGHAVTVYDERQETGGLVRYAIAPYRELREPLPGETRARPRAGRPRRASAGTSARRACSMLAETNDAVVLAVGMGPDARAHIMGDDLDGVWDSLPFIERIKTESAPRIGRRVVVIGGGNTAIDVAIEAVRLGAETVTLLYRRTEAEMPAYPHEVEQARAEGVEIRLLTSPVRFLGRTWLEGVECVRMELGEPDESGRATARAGSRQRARAPVRDGDQGDRPGAARGARRMAGRPPARREGPPLGRPADGRTSEPWVYAAGDATNGGATVVEAVRQGKLVARTVDDDLQRSREGDPLARASRPGREDGGPAPRGRAAARGQECPGVSRVRAGAARRTHARVHALRRPADPAPRLRRGAGCGRRPRAVARAARRPTSRMRSSSSTPSSPWPGALCIPRGLDRRAKGVNMVMLGALAAALGEPELDRLAEAAVEVLGGKTDAAELHAALEGGYAAVKEQRWAA